MRPRLLDLYCGAGGASMGYHRAGFEVVGVDHALQPRYPFEFHQADALTFPLEGFDVIHASPPCQAFTTAISDSVVRARHPNLIPATRDRLLDGGKPYVIENVPRAPLLREWSVMLCGTFFGLRVFRHRLFELGGVVPPLVPRCAHGALRIGLDMESVVGNGHGSNCCTGRMAAIAGGACSSRMMTVAGDSGCSSNHRAAGRYKYESLASWRDAMGIDWMSRRELTQAIPPAYTEWLGRWLLADLRGRDEKEKLHR